MAHSNLYVFGLPDGLDDGTFRQLFAAYGNVLSTKYYADKRYGFVKYASAQEAEAVIKQVNGFEYNGSQIGVRLANNDRDQLISKVGNSGAGCGNLGLSCGASNAVEPPQSDNLYIKGLPAGITDQSLREIFSSYGIVIQTRVLQAQAISSTDPNGESVALVRMATMDQAQWLVDNLNGNIPHGLNKAVQVKFANTPSMNAQKQAQKGEKGSGLRYSPYGDVSMAGQVVFPEAQNMSAEFPPVIPEMAAVERVVTPPQAVPARVVDATDIDHSCLHVLDLPANGNDVYLYKVFSPFGAIDCVHCVLTPQGTCSGVGYVKFSLPSDAQMAISAVNGISLPDGNILRVSVKKPRRQRQFAPVVTNQVPQQQYMGCRNAHMDNSLPAGCAYPVASVDIASSDPGVGHPPGGPPDAWTDVVQAGAIVSPSV